MTWGQALSQVYSLRARSPSHLQHPFLSLPTYLYTSAPSPFALTPTAAILSESSLILQFVLIRYLY